VAILKFFSVLPPPRWLDTLASLWTCEDRGCDLSIILQEPVMNAMTNDSTLTKAKGNLAWKEIVARYQKPSVGRGVWQIVNTLVPYAALWYLMYLSLSVSYWLVVPLAVLAGGVMVRLVGIQHVRGQGSVVKSGPAKDVWGF